ncbi:MAG: T9SS type A sorting domain-containing protein [Bacteroidota bacterium]
MIRIKLFVIGLFVSLASWSQTDTLTVVAYNLLNFPDGRDDCGTNTVVPDRSDTLGKILSYMRPDVLAVCEIQNEAGMDSIMNHSFSFANAPNYQSAPFTSDGSLNNGLFYDADKLTFYSHDQVQTYPREIDHYVLYMNDPNLGTYYDTTFVDYYVCHLKAGNSSSNENIRFNQTSALMDYIALQPSDHHHFVLGDFNVYSAYESGYQELFAGPVGLKDPINAPGNWNNNGNFSWLHTQSTRTSMNYDCGSKGGLDDRFDQILVSQNVLTGSDSLRYISNSYEAVGNDGNHFNSNLLAGSNSMYPDSIVNALYYMSDHLPVSMKAIVTYPTSNGLALLPSYTKVTCPGGDDGTATITPNDGTPPYSYLWSASAGNQTTQTATNLSTGQHCVTVTDDQGEQDNYCIYVPSPDPFAVNQFVSAGDGNCDGSIQLLVEGGEAPYTFDWSHSATASGMSQFDLCAGDYTVTITDDSGCDTTLTIELDDVSIDQFEADGRIDIHPNPVESTLTVEGDIDPSTIRLMNQMGQTMSLELEVLEEDHFQIQFEHLPAGVYFLRVESDEVFKVVSL